MYALLPAFSLALITGGVASAHGMFGFGGLGNLTPDQIATNQQTMFQKHADLLGVSVDEVKNAWAEGKSMQQLATEKGISTDQLMQKMHDQRKQEMRNVLSTLVQKGVITQAQADKRAELIDQMPTSSFRGKGMMMGGKGMMMGGKGFGHQGMGMDLGL